MTELNDPFGGSTQALIDNAKNTLTALVNRVVAWQNLEVTETKNAQTRLAKIKELEAKNAEQKAEIETFKKEKEDAETLHRNQLAEKDLAIRTLKQHNESLVQKLASFEAHPDVIADKKKVLQAEKERLEREIKKLDAINVSTSPQKDVTQSDKTDAPQDSPVAIL